MDQRGRTTNIRVSSYIGKHKGKRLDEVPDTYLVKYLIPQKGATGRLGGQCPRVVDAVEDFMKRHPDVESQAGEAKTKPLKEGMLKQPAMKKRRRNTAETSA